MFYQVLEGTIRYVRDVGSFGKVRYRTVLYCTVRYVRVSSSFGRTGTVRDGTVGAFKRQRPATLAGNKGRENSFEHSFLLQLFSYHNG